MATNLTTGDVPVHALAHALADILTYSADIRGAIGAARTAHAAATDDFSKENRTELVAKITVLANDLEVALAKAARNADQYL